MKKPTIKSLDSKPYPSKGTERSTEEPSTVVENAKEPPPELAKTYTASEAQQIISMNLRPIEQRWLTTTIEGEDLITHSWSEKAMKEMLANQQRTKEEKKLAKLNRAAKDPKQEFDGARYRWDNKDWFPVNGIKKSMVSAGFAMGIPRSIIQRCIFIVGSERRDYVEIKYSRVVMREDAVRVGPFGKREADLRYRPEYQSWSADLRIQYRADIISADQVVMLLQNAGFSVGIGEWRPEKDGQAGRFQVQQVAEKGKKHAA